MEWKKFFRLYIRIVLWFIIGGMVSYYVFTHVDEIREIRMMKTTTLLKVAWIKVKGIVYEVLQWPGRLWRICIKGIRFIREHTIDYTAPLRASGLPGY